MNTKEYRLKQWYPSLPKEWKDIDPLVVVSRGYYYSLHPSLKNKVLFQGEIFYLEVEGNPEYWRLIEPEKDRAWEIVTFEGKFGISYDFYNHNMTLHEIIGFLHSGSCNITSIKRLGDEKIFSIGQPVKFHNGISKITRIEIDLSWQSGIVLYGESEADAVALSIAEITEPLFTTEDGVAIYEGDEYWDTHAEAWRPRKRIAELGDQNFNFAKFSSYKEAQEWIEDDKPRYSKKDIQQAINEQSGIYINGCILCFDGNEFWESLEK